MRKPVEVTSDRALLIYTLHFAIATYKANNRISLCNSKNT